MEAGSAPQPTLAEIRKQYGEHLTDEELLLRYLIPGPDVDAMQAAGHAIKPVYPLAGDGGIAWLKDALGSSTARTLQVTRDGVSVSLRR